MTFEERMESIGRRLDGLTQNLELQASLQADAEARHNREMEDIRGMLRRAVRLSVQEARNERQKRRELAQRQQEAADLANQRHQELQALLKAFLERGGNGQH